MVKGKWVREAMRGGHSGMEVFIVLACPLDDRRMAGNHHLSEVSAGNVVVGVWGRCIVNVGTPSQDRGAIHKEVVGDASFQYLGYGLIRS